MSNAVMYPETCICGEPIELERKESWGHAAGDYRQKAVCSDRPFFDFFSNHTSSFWVHYDYQDNFVRTSSVSIPS